MSKQTCLLSLFVLSVAFLLPTICYGYSEYEISFNKTYGGEFNEFASYAVETNDAGYVIIGSTNTFGHGDSDIWVIKIDPKGNIEWNTTYGTPSFESPHYIIRTENGFLITGRTNHYGEGDMDLLLLEIDQKGALLWNRTIGGDGDEWMWDIEKTSEGGYALGGRTNSYGSGGNDYWLMKIDVEGNLEWNTTLGGVEDERARSLVISDDGGYLLNGWSSSYTHGLIDFWLVKTDQNGLPLWNHSYGFVEGERGIALMKTEEGGYLLGGNSNTFSEGLTDFYLVKTDSKGEILWNKTYGGENAETIHHLLSLKDGSYVLAGYTESYGAGSRDFYVIFTDSDGNLYSELTFGGSEYEGLSFAITTSDDGLLIGGHSYSFGSGEADFYVVKLSQYLEPEPEPEPTPESQPEPKQEELSGGIPGFNMFSVSIGLIVASFVLLYKRH
jgi:hypothetical protein